MHDAVERNVSGTMTVAAGIWEWTGQCLVVVVCEGPQVSRPIDRLASTIVAANFVESNTLVIAIMSIAFFGQGMVNLGWTLISDVAPRQFVGLTGGVFNLCANLAGIVTPIVVGLIVGQTGSFYGALAFIGILALIGAAAYVFIVGDVKRVELD